jgi:SGNH domain (fused to AT3 domains)
VVTETTPDADADVTAGRGVARSACPACGTYAKLSPDFVGLSVQSEVAVRSIRRGQRVRRAVLAPLVTVISLLAGGLAGATGAPTPGTAAQVARLVALSHRITQVDATVAAVLSGPSDIPQRHFPAVANGCNTVTQCVFGDVRGSRTVVLFGDSHAMMWVPALDPVARHDGVRLVLLWAPACPASMVTGYTYIEEVVTTNAQCASWKQAEIRAIHALHPAAVLIGERTGAIVHAATHARFTTAQWAAGLQATISRLKAGLPATKIGVFEDLVFFDSDVPVCLSAYPTAVQARCSVANPNPRYPGQQVAEREVARATGAALIATRQWFCTTRCSPIVGNMVTYYNEGHVSATYAEFLSGVLGTELAPLLR